jgi:hypothetical protein
MVFHFGAAGTAQQYKTANAGTAPTDVSLAEAASTGQNNAFRVLDNSTSNTDLEVAYSDWTAISGSTLTFDVVAEDVATNYEGESSIRLDTYAYLRATGATSFSYVASLDDHNLSREFPEPTVGGAGSTNQDATSGTGRYFEIHPTEGGDWPGSGNYITFSLRGTATNSFGSTTATLLLKYNFTA